MPKCPQCGKQIADFTRRCPSCQADLDLLVDYVSHLQGGLQRAENLTKAGELSQAFWAYMEVLEVDPDNAAARRQVGQVVTAVRQFDRIAEGRRWMQPPQADKWKQPWLYVAGIAILVVGLTLGYIAGQLPAPVIDDSLLPDTKSKSLSGK